MGETLSIIKPDAVRNHQIGKILSQLEANDLKIVSLKMMTLTRKEAEYFYSEHKDKGFFKELIDFMCSGPIVTSILSGDEAIQKNRTIMGATNPAQAADGTLRSLYGSSIDNNAVHGSDSEKSAAREIAFFFPEYQLISV